MATFTRERDVREAYAAQPGEPYGFAVRSLGDAGPAEEAVQETFVRAWRAGDRSDPEIGSLRTWLFAILRNHRRVLFETHYRDRPHAEVAAELGVPEGTLKSRVYYGPRALRVVLEEMGHEE